MQHVDEGTIHAWLDGALADTEAAEVERHVAGCDACAAAVAEARGLMAASSRILTALDDVPAGVLPDHSPGSEDRLSALRARHAAERESARRRRGVRRTWLSAAAIAFVAVGTAVVWRSGVRGPEVPGERLESARQAASAGASTAATPASAPAPAGSASTRPAPAGAPARGTGNRVVANAETTVAPAKKSADRPAAPPALGKGEVPRMDATQPAARELAKGAASRAVGAIGDSMVGRIMANADVRQGLANAPVAEAKVAVARDVDAAVGCYRLDFPPAFAARAAYPAAVRLLSEPDSRDGAWYRAVALGDSAPAAELRWQPGGGPFILIGMPRDSTASPGPAPAALRVALGAPEEVRPHVAAAAPDARPVAAARIACPRPAPAPAPGRSRRGGGA